MECLSYFQLRFYRLRVEWEGVKKNIQEECSAMTEEAGKTCKAGGLVEEA